MEVDARRAPARAWPPASRRPASRCRPRAAAARAPRRRPAARRARRACRRRRRRGRWRPRRRSSAPGVWTSTRRPVAVDDARADPPRDLQRAYREALVGAAGLDLEARPGDRARSPRSAASTAAAPIASSSASAETRRATENDTRPKTRSRRAAASSTSSGRTRTRMRPWVLCTSAPGEIGDGRADVVAQHALEATAVAALEKELAVAAENDAPVLRHGRGLLPARGALGEGRDRMRAMRAASRSAATAPSTSACVVSRDSEKRSTAGAVVDADRLQGRAGAGRARGAGRAGRGETPRASSACSSGSAGQPRERQRGDVRRARRAGHRRRASATAASAPTRSRRSRCVATRLGAAGLERRRASAAARPSPTIAGRFSVPPRSPRSWPPPTQSGSRRAPGRTQSAPAPRGPCSLWRESASCRRRARADAGAGGRTPARRRRAGAAGAAIGARAGGRSRRSAGPCRSRCCTSMTATTAVSGRTAAATSSARHDAVGPGRDDGQRGALGRPAPRRCASPRGARAR